ARREDSPGVFLRAGAGTMGTTKRTNGAGGLGYERPRSAVQGAAGGVFLRVLPAVLPAVGSPFRLRADRLAQAGDLSRPAARRTPCRGLDRAPACSPRCAVAAPEPVNGLGRPRAC